MTANPYEIDLDPNPANYAPLTPIGFLERSAAVYPDRISLVHGNRRHTWAETYARCRRLASSLAARGVGRGDTVSVMAPNVPATYEATLAVPMLGAVVNTINTRLDASTVAFILEHGEAKAIITDRELSPTVEPALAKLERRPLVIDVDDPDAAGGELLGEVEYEAFLAGGDPEFDWRIPNDEWGLHLAQLHLRHHRKPQGRGLQPPGAYLNAMTNAVAWNMAHHPVYLWTLPMFHCNGWCFPWTLAAVAGTGVCLRRVEAKAIYDAIADEGVTHFCGAPIVLNFLLNAPDADRRPLDRAVQVMTAGAAPPAAVLEGMEASGFRITHVYGLTETYGPSVICSWKPEWDELPARERAEIKARQGVRYHALDGLAVMNPETMTPVPSDGETMGEVMMRGNIVMKGYLKNPGATRAAFDRGWFHSGDLAVRHPDGYIQLKDRSKDIIISGGENISSIEVEDCLFRHPSVLEAAVVAKPDDRWGETPCAFVTLRPGAEATEREIIDWCRSHLAHFKCPTTVVFRELPKTSTGKIQKFRLRDEAVGS